MAEKNIVNLLDDMSDGAALLFTGKQRKGYGKQKSQFTCWNVICILLS